MRPDEALAFFRSINLISYWLVGEIFLSLQFVNSSFERQTGYLSTEVVGNCMQERLQVDNCNEEETLAYRLKQQQVCDAPHYCFTFSTELGP